MTRLFLVRHGPTHAKTMIGWTDLPADLSDLLALARLNAYLPQAPVVSSDLWRATATADCLSSARPRLPHEPGFREIHFGAWEQRSFAQAEADQPSLIRAFWDSPGQITAPDGESWDDVTKRVWAALDRHLESTDPGPKDLIIVAHFGAILACLQRALGVSAVQVFSHKIDNLSVTELTCDSTGWTVGRINHIP